MDNTLLYNSSGHIVAPVAADKNNSPALHWEGHIEFVTLYEISPRRPEYETSACDEIRN